MLSDKEKLAKLIEHIKATIPYVTATIRRNNSFDVKEMIGAAEPTNTKDWMAIHRGRAGSSERQLEGLLELATMLEKQ